MVADLALPWDKGRKTAGDELAFPQGFLTRMENAIYVPSDPDRPYKIPGRTLAGTLTGDQATTPKGITFLQYDNGVNKLLLLANSQFYEITASQTLAAWASVDDQTPVAFSRTGAFVKSMHDGLNRAICWTGVASERPLVRDQDGNWRFLSFKKPVGTLTLATIVTATPPTIVRPGTSTTPTNTSEGVPAGGWSDTAKAFDTDVTTFSYATLSATGLLAQNWNFTAGGSTGTGQSLSIKVASSSSVDSPGTTGRQPGGSFSGHSSQPSNVAQLIIQVSTTGGGNPGTFTTIFAAPLPVVVTTIQFALPNVLWTNVVVRAMLRYHSGTNQVTGYVYDIMASNAGSNGGTATVTAGTYQYVQTEAYSVTLNGGRIVTVESAPSDVASVTVTDANTRGVTVTLLAQTNGLSDGVKDDPTNRKILTKNIYRSTSTGGYPDLGRIAILPITQTTYIDTFETAGTVLASPSIQVVFLEDAIFPRDSQAPDFLDATLYRGAVVAIPKNDPYRIQWSAPGLPESWPLPHDLSILPSDRNDKCSGVVTLGDVVLIFTSTRVLRLIDLPMITAANFNVSRVRIDTLSPWEGLAGNPKAYCIFHSQTGAAVCAWVSASGIWMTDGGLPSERGLGVTRLTTHKDWSGDVDTTRLQETALTFDPILQVIYFDYYDTAGTLRCEAFHISALHWVQSGEGQMVPKVSGPHTLTADSRTVGETSTAILHWALDKTTPRILNERQGTDNAGSAILTHLETGWLYPADHNTEYQVYGASLLHSDWGPSENCDMEFLVRHDVTGTIQVISNKGVDLSGSRVTNMGLQQGSGQSFRAIFRHNGQTTSPPTRALGPVILEMEEMDDVRAD